MKMLRAGTLIDGTGAPPVRDATVLIDQGRIEAVTTGGPSGRLADAEVIDAGHLTVLPGLIDCHDHLAFHGYELVRRWGLDEPQSTRHLRTARVASQVLASGYTALRDAGGLDAGFRLAIQEGLITGPRLVLSGCTLEQLKAMSVAVPVSAQCRSPAVATDIPRLEALAVIDGVRRHDLRRISRHEHEAPPAGAGE